MPCKYQAITFWYRDKWTDWQFLTWLTIVSLLQKLVDIKLISPSSNEQRRRCSADSVVHTFQCVFQLQNTHYFRRMYSKSNKFLSASVPMKAKYKIRNTHNLFSICISILLVFQILHKTVCRSRSDKYRFCLRRVSDGTLASQKIDDLSLIHI